MKLTLTFVAEIKYFSTKGFSLLLLLIFWSCRQTYDPGLNDLAPSILIVEGNLNPGNDTTVIHLTRTLAVYDSDKIKPETNAQLTVEDRNNTSQSLSETGNGYYISPNLNLQINNEYRLRIKTSGGKEYLSKYVKATKVQEIDSLSWDIDTSGIRIYVTTHDPTNSTIYYRWEYVETWEIRSYWFSSVVYENGVIRPRVSPPDENIFICWKYDSSHTIELANSERLTDDIIYRRPLRLIPYHNERLSKRYSILVKQYALDKEAYDFFELLKRNTEDIGGIFSPLPLQLQGNIRSVQDTTDYAIGYVTASTVTQKRIFISNQDLIYWRFRLVDCENRITIPNNISSLRYYVEQLDYEPYEEVNIGGFIAGYFAARPYCVDCRTRGGSTIRPPYW